MTLHFYEATRPSSATPVRWALTELDVPHETTALDLDAGEQRAPAFLALDPNGRVPTLVVDGAPMFEGLAIIQWVGARYGVERGLWPKDEDPARLRAMSWSAWGYVTLGALTQMLHRLGPKEEALRASVMARQAELLEILDGELSTRPFVAGETFTLADVAVGSIVSYASFAGQLPPCPAHVQAWLDRLQRRPAFGAAFAL